MNTIETATIIQSELDKAAVEQATSGWMEVNEKLVKYTGGAEVKIPSLDMDGMADYDRTNGFVQGSVNFQYETKKMTQDRGRSFSFDENDVDETNFVLTASTVMGEFQRTKVVPEIDAYRYSTMLQRVSRRARHPEAIPLMKQPFSRNFTMILQLFRRSLDRTHRWLSPLIPW